MSTASTLATGPTKGEAMRVIRDEMALCECCAVMLANDDDSGCRDYYGHAEHALVLFDGMADVVLADSEDGFRVADCAGCGVSAQVTAYAVQLGPEDGAL
jgi:hypothetical protein